MEEKVHVVLGERALPLPLALTRRRRRHLRQVGAWRGYCCFPHSRFNLFFFGLVVIQRKDWAVVTGNIHESRGILKKGKHSWALVA